MDKSRRDIYKVLGLSSDLAGVLASWAAAFYLRFYGAIPVFKGIPQWQIYFKLVPFIIVIWATVLSLHGVYGLPGRWQSPWVRSRKIFQACSIATLAFIVLEYFYEEYKYSRATLVLFALIHPLAIMGGRALLDLLVKRVWFGGKSRSILLIGSGQGFYDAYAQVHRYGASAKTRVGAILVGTQQQVLEGERFGRERGIVVQRLPERWPEFFLATPYDSVVLVLPYQSYQFIEDNLAELADQVLDIKLIPDLQRFTKFSSNVELVEGLPVIYIHDSPLQGPAAVLKRIVDVGGALVALLLFAPLMLVTAILVKLTSPGPVFYRQKRMGLDGREFSIYKFRTMGQAAEASSGAVWATSHDQRTTRVGKFLRRTSLDELPQLHNVLRGDMSLVGPRPERPVFVAEFRKKVPGYMLRHKAKAGITGWAQVNGWRGNTSIEKRIEYDLYYIHHWSLWFDLKILFLTIVKGFVNPNAY